MIRWAKFVSGVESFTGTRFVRSLIGARARVGPSGIQDPRYLKSSSHAGKMLLQEPPETQYDLRFNFLGFPVRVSWTFWLGAIVIGHGFAQGIDLSNQGLSPGIGPLLLLWTLCVLVSILIHELGHALAFRQFGIQSSIVLYHFGGLAIPIGSLRPGVSANRLSEKQDLWVTAAGPLAQLISAAVVIAVVKILGYSVPFLPLGVSALPGLSEGKQIDSFGLLVLLIFYLYPSIFWAVLNLMPVWPLDGGRITRSLVLLSGGTTSQALWISIIAASGLAWYAFSRGGFPIMGIFFLMFAISNYQMLQQSGGWR